jgi:Phytanoyl-CoA dioxygenase (PhyH)
MSDGTTNHAVDADAHRRKYQDDGFCVIPGLFLGPVVTRAANAAEAVAQGKTDTGLSLRLSAGNADDERQTLIKIAERHNASHDLRGLITCPAPWGVIAAVVGARMLQVWAVDLFIKRTEHIARANIGWHQDGPFAPFWHGDIFTVWIALSDVTADSSPLRYVRGSHRLGPLGRADLFRTDLDLSLADFDLPPGFAAGRVAARVPAGGVALHQRDTLHASGPKTAGRSRMPLAIRVRTDRCQLTENVSQVAHLADPVLAPIVFDERSAAEVAGR